jgi:chromosome segregation ATPase
MKLRVLLPVIIGLLLPALSLQAQKIKISVDEKSDRIAGGQHNCLVVVIYDAKAADIEKEWRSKMKGYDAKVSGKDEIFADNAMIKEISENTIDVYARTENGSNENEVKLIVGFQMGEDWLSSGKYAAQYKAAEKIVRDFAKKMTQDAIGDKRKDEEKKLKTIQGDQADLEKKNKNLHEDITDYQEKIQKAEGEIKTNEEEQAKKKTEMEAQQKAVDAIKARESSVE